MLAEAVVGMNQITGIAYIVIGFGASSSSKVDSSHQTGRGFRRKGDGGKASGGNTHGHNVSGVYLGQGARVVDGNAQVLGGVFAGGLVIGLGTPATFARLRLAAGGSVAAAHDDERDPSPAGKPESLRKLLPGC